MAGYARRAAFKVRNGLALHLCERGSRPCFESHPIPHGMTPRFGLSLTPIVFGGAEQGTPPLSPLSAIAAAPTTLFLARPTSGDSAGRWVGRSAIAKS